MDTKKIPELLSPAGSIESLQAAVNSGCDAVYFGGKNFSARSYASNFSNDEIKEAVEYCKLRDIKTYLTLNTLIKEKELKDVYNYLKEIYLVGVDALILQDIGIARLVKEYFPLLDIHASTQMTAHSKDDVLYLKQLGFSRVVLSRELSLKEIKEIKDTCDIEIETFIHGALCYSYSGQCLMSSFIGGRSGNRGKCAQPCRLPYNLIEAQNKMYNNDKYLLSLKDVETLDIIPQIAQVGIDSLKIEGRMKRPEYVAGVTHFYRKYLNLYNDNKPYKVDNEDREEIKQLFNRGGFSKGYYLDKENMIFNINPKNAGIKVGEIISVNRNVTKVKVTKDLNPGDGIEILTDQQPHPGTMVNKNVSQGQVLSLNIKGNIKVGQEVFRTRDKKLIDKFTTNINEEIKRDITAKISIKKGMAALLTLNCNDIVVNVEGPIIQESINKPTDKERIIQQISKLGNTPFILKDMDENIEEDIFIPISELNQLRREAVEKLIDAILLTKEGKVKPFELINKKENVVEKRLTIHLNNFNQLKAIESKKLYIVYIEFTNFNEGEIKEAIKMARLNNFEIFLALPHILKTKFYSDLKALDSFAFDGYLIRTLGQYHWCIENSNKKRVIDYTLNTFNNKALSHWVLNGADKVTSSVELNSREIADLHYNNNIEYFAYGYLPVMITEQCVVKDIGNTCKADKSGMYYLKDRMNNLFPVERICKYCYSKIYNISPVYLLNQGKELDSLPVSSFRLSFLNETNEEINCIIRGYEDVIVNNKPVELLDRDTKRVLDRIQTKGFTKGHLARGVE